MLMNAIWIPYALGGEVEEIEFPMPAYTLRREKSPPKQKLKCHGGQMMNILYMIVPRGTMDC